MLEQGFLSGGTQAKFTLLTLTTTTVPSLYRCQKCDLVILWHWPPLLTSHLRSTLPPSHSTNQCLVMHSIELKRSLRILAFVYPAHNLVQLVYQVGTPFWLALYIVQSWRFCFTSMVQWTVSVVKYWFSLADFLALVENRLINPVLEHWPVTDIECYKVNYVYHKLCYVMGHKILKSIE